MTPLEKAREEARKIILLITGGDMETTPWMEYEEEIQALLRFAAQAWTEGVDAAYNNRANENPYKAISRPPATQKGEGTP